ncbi:MAG TPA: sugar phosphate nucleotidyltransferase [Bryobacteraceae bacterium]|nr:sugar phosphate nucleotidyltransferase [Bryobacteraceae bacterium]
MKVVLFCGGMGLRLRDYSENVPKPMVPIGYRPILWHIMKYYAHYGHKDFVLALGYKADAIKEYFLRYDECVSNDFVLSGGGKSVELIDSDIRDWRITFVDTGVRSGIGRRLKLVQPYLEGEDTFLANYADNLTDCPLPVICDRFVAGNKVCTLLAARPRLSFHVVAVDGASTVSGIHPMSSAGLWINGGYFAFKRRIFDYLNLGDDLVGDAFPALIRDGEVNAYSHEGFWASMETFKDRQELEDLYVRGEAPWAVWESAKAAIRARGNNHVAASLR